MATYRFPVLIWEDFDGYFTAALVPFNNIPAAVAKSADEALRQLREFLQWGYKENSWWPAPDFQEAEQLTLRVDIRPEYHANERIYPSAEVMPIKVPCVYGRQSDGIFIGTLPTLGIHFYYYEERALKELVSHYLQEALKGKTPQALSRYLPPKEVRLEEISLNIFHTERGEIDEADLEALPSVAEPLGDRALRKQYSRAYERDREVAELVLRLERETASVILVGESGVGKTTILVDAVRQLEREAEKPDRFETDAYKLHRRKFWMTSGGRLIAGMRYLGQWEQRAERVIYELARLNGVLCVENLLELLHSGGTGAPDSLASFFLPYIQRGELRLVGEATPAELDACRRLLPGFADAFQIVNIEGFQQSGALAVLQRVVAMQSSNLYIEAAFGTVGLIYRLFKRFSPYASFPGRSVGFVNELFHRASLDGASSINEELVIRQFIRQTGLPEKFLRDETTLQADEVRAEFSAQVIGQHEACERATNLVLTFKAGLNDPQRPISVLLFCGPTGVGKTELAKAISRYFFGHGEQYERLVRLDMSEYSLYGSASRLVTGEDGGVSDFIKRVRAQPFTVVLLDEIEKAAPDVFDLFLSVFDEGRLTDRFGRVTTFRSAVMIMTSNLGAERFEGLGFGKTQAPSYAAEAMAFFRPEFFNRIDAIVQFNPLDEAMIVALTEKELREIARREGMERYRVRLEWTEALIRWLAHLGYDPRYGARPLQRTIENLIIVPLSRYLLDHPKRQPQTLVLDLSESQELKIREKGDI